MKVCNHIAKTLLLTILLTLSPTVVSSAQTLTDTLTVYFRQGKMNFDPAYRNNGERMDRFVGRVRSVAESTGLKIISVTHCSYTSPEGSAEINERLAAGRSSTLTSILSPKLDFPDSIVKAINLPADYSILSELISSSSFSGRDAALDFLSSSDGLDLAAFRSALGDGAYKYIYNSIFPKMRRHEVIISFIPEISGTVIEEEPDTVDIQEIVLEPDDSLSAELPLAEPVVEPAAPDTSLVEPAEEPAGVKTGWTVKTNAIGIAMALANAAVEYQLPCGVAFHIPFYYSGVDYFKNTLKFRTVTVQPGVRYYFKGPDRFWLGLHLGVGWYNVAYGGKWRIQDHEGRRPAYGGGLDLGYRLLLKEAPYGDWGLEFSLGGGVYSTCSDKFYNEENGPYSETAIKKTFFGVDGAGISVTFRPNRKDRRSR